MPRLCRGSPTFRCWSIRKGFNSTPQAVRFSSIFPRHAQSPSCSASPGSRRQTGPSLLPAKIFQWRFAETPDSSSPFFATLRSSPPFRSQTAPAWPFWTSAGMLTTSSSTPNAAASMSAAAMGSSMCSRQRAANTCTHCHGFWSADVALRSRTGPAAGRGEGGGRAAREHLGIPPDALNLNCVSCDMIEPRQISPSKQSVKLRLSIAGLCLVLTAATPALAFRPFDGTDAAVADTGKMEVELQPAGRLHDDSGTTLIAPATRFNFGLTEGWEGVLEGLVQTPLSPSVPSSLTAAGAFLKGVVRPGSLQDKAGPSVATEFGVLLPD